eukprot:486027-Hanusia_phi.AAC.2
MSGQMWRVWAPAAGMLSFEELPWGAAACECRYAGASIPCGTVSGPRKRGGGETTVGEWRGRDARQG